jgi:hypothetical protein
MKNDPRYTPWLEIANELEALHGLIYGTGGCFEHRKDRPIQLSGLLAARWIRNKCATGWWYWWDKTTIAGKAEEPLRSLDYVIGDGGGRFEETEAGRAMIAKIKQIQMQIDAIK